MIKDSGERIKFESGAVRDIQEGRAGCDLLPAAAILRLARHYEEGAKKYGDRKLGKRDPAAVIYRFWNAASFETHGRADGRGSSMCGGMESMWAPRWDEKRDC